MQEEVRDRRRERLVRVAVADNTFTGEMLRDQLREAGIPSMLRNREGGVGVISGPGGTFELFVLEGDAARASTVLGGDPHPSLCLHPDCLHRPLQPSAVAGGDRGEREPRRTGCRGRQRALLSRQRAHRHWYQEREYLLVAAMTLCTGMLTVIEADLLLKTS